MTEDGETGGHGRLLYHFPLSAPSRIVRLALAEKRLEFDLRVERAWERRVEFLTLNPAGEVPVLVEADGTTLTHPWIISEFLDEGYPDYTLLGQDLVSRIEARRLMIWFDQKFDAEVTRNLVGEKVVKRLTREGHPSSEAIRAGKTNIHYHLDYISYLAESRRWLAGDYLSMADLAAAAHLSVIDYLGDAPWDEFPEAKMWYARIKSRPSFRPLLTDTLSGLPPAAHYTDLDF